MSNPETTDMNTENITSIIKEETGLTITPPVRKRKIIKKAAEPSMKEATELAEGKTLVIKEEEKADPVLTLTDKQKADMRSEDGLRIYAQLRVEHDKWMKLYLELKEKTDPLLAKLEEQRQKRNEASKKSKKASREKNKAVKTDLEERVKKLEEKIAEKEFTEVLGEDADEEDELEDEEKKVYHECSNCKGDMCDQYGWCVNCMKRTEKMVAKCEQCDDNEQDGLGPLCSECVREKEEQSDAE
jgi:hypothetical protein